MENKELIIKSSGNELFIDHFHVSDTAPNLMFCCTPVISVVEMRTCYEPFADKGFNVFAIDFSGIGKSTGAIVSAETIFNDINSVAAYVKQNYRSPLFFFADGGIGGILGQFYASRSTEIDAFAQFACGIYRDLSPMKMPARLGIIARPLINLMAKLFPSLKLKFSVPSYNGINAEADNDFYTDLFKRHPKADRMEIRLMAALMDIFVAPDSSLAAPPAMPTLVFKTTHDRYFPEEYFDKYFTSLTAKKRLITVENVHNSYYFQAEYFADEVAKWFTENS